MKSVPDPQTPSAQGWADRAHAAVACREGEDCGPALRAKIERFPAHFSSRGEQPPANPTPNNPTNTMKPYEEHDDEHDEKTPAPALSRRATRAACLLGGLITMLLTACSLAAAVAAFVTLLLALAALLLPGVVTLRANGGELGPVFTSLTAAFLCALACSLTYFLHSVGEWFFNNADELAQR